MPAKIIMGSSNNQSGEINIGDVQKMFNDFRTKITVGCSDPSRNPVHKRFYFDIEVEKVAQILNNVNGADKKKIRINFSLNMPNQLNCDNSASIENFLSIALCAIDKKSNKSLLRNDDLILVDGFNDHTDFSTVMGGGDPCCVQGSPFLSV